MLVPSEVEFGNLLRGDLDAGRVFLAEQAGRYGEAGLGSGSADVVEDRLPAEEWESGPVLADFAAEAVLDRVVIRWPRRIVGDGDGEAVAIAEAMLQTVLPSAWAVAVAVALVYNCIRFLLPCDGRGRASGENARASLEELFLKHKLPERLRRDSGVPVASAGGSEGAIRPLSEGVHRGTAAPGAGSLAVKNGVRSSVARLVGRAAGAGPARILGAAQDACGRKDEAPVEGLLYQ